MAKLVVLLTAALAGTAPSNDQQQIARAIARHFHPRDGLNVDILAPLADCHCVEIVWDPPAAGDDSLEAAYRAQLDVRRAR